MSQLKHQHVLILGLGISGLSMAHWCARLGAKVTVIDTRQTPPLWDAFKQLQTKYPDLAFKSQAFSADLIEGSDIRAVFKSPGLSPASVTDVIRPAKASGLWVGNELSLFNLALRDLKALYQYAPKVLGITGTNGKTTVTSLTGQLVERAGKTVAIAGNIGPALLDTLVAHLDAFERDQTPLPQVWVLELSSFQLDGVDDFEPTAATILNITQDHLDWHGSMDAYATAKENVYGKNKAQTQIHVSSSTPDRVNTYGIETQASMTWLVRAVPESDDLPVKTKKGVAPLALPFAIQRLMPADALRIRGVHNAINALAALALAASAGCSIAPMLYGLREYRGEPHRLESVAIVNDVEYIDDSKGTNIGATVTALSSLGIDKCRADSSKKIIVILGGDGKGQDFAPLIQPVQAYVKAAILIGRDAPAIAVTLKDAGVLLHRAKDLSEAVQQCATFAVSGDIVLLSPACASLDMFKDYKHRAEVFIEAVQALAADRGGSAL